MSRTFWLVAIAAVSALGGYFIGLRYRNDASFMLPPKDIHTWPSQHQQDQPFGRQKIIPRIHSN